jgi:hypothetical protein
LYIIFVSLGHLNNAARFCYIYGTIFCASAYALGNAMWDYILTMLDPGSISNYLDYSYWSNIPLANHWWDDQNNLIYFILE